MPYQFNSARCAGCGSSDRCIEDRRNNPVRGRRTQFRVLQQNATHCTFEDFVPGYAPGEDDEYAQYVEQWEKNARQAADHLFGEAATLTHSQLAKCAGDVLEMLISAGLWNAAADWNRLMVTGKWESPLIHPGGVPCPDRRVAIVTLPRGYEVTRLFNPDTRRKIKAFQHALERNNMELRLSSPDVVAVRLPDPLPPDCAVFCERLGDLRRPQRELLEEAYLRLEGLVEGHGLLFAIAIKKSVRSDRLYQPLFEANVLKYLVQEVLRGSALRFMVVVMDSAGAAVEQHYKAASLFSLLRGGKAERAVDRLIELPRPRELLSSVLSELPAFPV